MNDLKMLFMNDLKMLFMNNNDSEIQKHQMCVLSLGYSFTNGKKTYVPERP